VRRITVTATLTYLHGDHLGSVSLTTNASGQKVSEQRYKPYGEVRWASGSMPTDFTFTSQRAGITVPFLSPRVAHARLPSESARRALAHAKAVAANPRIIPPL